MKKDRGLKRYYRKQKLIGLALIALCVLITCIDMEGTIAVLGVPLGLWLIFTKQLIVEDDYKDELEEKQKAQ